MRKETDGSTVACHSSRAKALRQLSALYASEPKLAELDFAEQRIIAAAVLPYCGAADEETPRERWARWDAEHPYVPHPRQKKSEKPVPGYGKPTDYSALANLPTGAREQVERTLNDLQKQWGVTLHRVELDPNLDAAMRAGQSYGRHITINPKVFDEEWLAKAIGAPADQRYDRWMVSRNVNEMLTHEYGHLIDQQLREAHPREYKRLADEVMNMPNPSGWDYDHTPGHFVRDESGRAKQDAAGNLIENHDIPLWNFPKDTIGYHAQRISSYAYSGGMVEWVPEAFVKVARGDNDDYLLDRVRDYLALLR